MPSIIPVYTFKQSVLHMEAEEEKVQEAAVEIEIDVIDLEPEKEESGPTAATCVNVSVIKFASSKSNNSNSFEPSSSVDQPAEVVSYSSATCAQYGHRVQLHHEYARRADGLNYQRYLSSPAFPEPETETFNLARWNGEPESKWPIVKINFKDPYDYQYKTYNCVKCDGVLGFASMSAHVIFEQHDFEPKSPTTRDYVYFRNQRKTCQCPVCGKNWATQQQLRRHHAHHLKRQYYMNLH